MYQSKRDMWVGRISYLAVIVGLAYLNYLLWTSIVYIIFQVIFLVAVGFKLRIWQG